VLVWKLNRLVRRPKDFERLWEVAERREVFIASVTEPVDSSSPIGLAMLRILVALAGLESATTVCASESPSAPGDRYSEVAGLKVVDDGDGNLLSDGSREFHYDTLGRLQEASSHVGAPALPGPALGGSSTPLSAPSPPGAARCADLAGSRRPSYGALRSSASDPKMHAGHALPPMRELRRLTRNWTSRPMPRTLSWGQSGVPLPL
jgi:Resolvase, N terminal domain